MLNMAMKTEWLPCSRKLKSKAIEAIKNTNTKGEKNMERIYNKLVRDKIPKIIESKGELPVTKKLDLQQYKIALEEKLKEECQEVISASGQERIEELADVLEILRSLAKLEGVSLKQVIAVADQKVFKRGGFENKVFLEKVITKDSE